MYINSDFSRLEISLEGCQENYRYFRSKLESSTKLLVLVKANAYGHGAVEFARLMEASGADYLAVAYPVEGMELRQAGINSPVMVLTAGTDSFEQIINYGLEPGIPNMYSLKVLCEVLEKSGITDFPVHIKLDTGMHRLGFMTDELQIVSRNPSLSVNSISPSIPPSWSPPVIFKLSNRLPFIFEYRSSKYTE